MKQETLKGWIAWKDFSKGCLVGVNDKENVLEIGKWHLVDNSLHKFRKDEVCSLKDGNMYFLTGFLLNKKDLCKDNETGEWEDIFAHYAQSEAFPRMLRGGFSGFTDINSTINVFNDHVGNHTVYYYYGREGVVVSSRFCMIIEFLREMDIKVTLDDQAVKYMLEHGFMLDETTFAKEIKRVLPGEIISFTEKNSEITLTERKQYYELDFDHVDHSMTEQKAIEIIDHYFRQAVAREYEKDREYGYRHLVDLSGGLDSRMTAWVAHEMGYKDQLNFTYCKSGYWDYLIAQKIANKLCHPFYFRSLDDFSWFADVEQLCRLYNGAASYAGLTGAKQFLEDINCTQFGIEHTGMIGDVVLSSFYDESTAMSQATGHEKAYSQRHSFEIPQTVLQRYKNKELFAMGTRGFLGAQTSYFVRQNYVETASVFMDVDLLDAVFSIPLKYRQNHQIYLKWIQEKYPDAAEFGWEKWKGVKPKWNNRKSRKIRKWLTLLERSIMKVLGKEAYGMNPMDDWYAKNEKVRQYIETYYEKTKVYLADQELAGLVDEYFSKGNVTEKEQALTVVTMAKIVRG